MGRRWVMSACLLLAACGGGASDPPPVPLDGLPILVLTNGQVAAPTSVGASGVDLSALGLAVEQIAGTFAFTTPADVYFRFEVATTGAAVQVAHVLGGDDTGALTDANIFHATRGGGTLDGPWFGSAPGDVARIEIGGRIQASQMLVVRAGTTYALIRLDLGGLSTIHPSPSGGVDPAPLEDRLLTSSFDDAFGAPAVAPHTSPPVVTWFAGDDTDPPDDTVHHMRARAGTPATAGASPTSGAAHALAGDLATLVLARAEGTALTIEHSADFGVTFDAPQVLAGPGTVRHPVLAASQQALALVYWRDRQLVLVQGTYGPLTLQAEEVLYTAPDGAVLLRPAVALCDGAVSVAYAHASIALDVALAAIDVSTMYRCFLRAPGQADVDVPIAHEVGLGRGPGLACTAAGPLFYVAQGAGGLYLFEIQPSGAAAFRESFGTPGAHSPRAIARAGLDVCYLQPTDRGTEVHRARWADFDSALSLTERITNASRRWRTRGRSSSPVVPVYVPGNQPVPWIGYEGQQVSEDGFDAAADAVGLHVICHEERTDRFFFLRADPTRTIQFIGIREALPPPVYVAPSSVPTLTGPLGGVNASDRHWLRLLRLD